MGFLLIFRVTFDHFPPYFWDSVKNSSVFLTFLTYVEIFNYFVIFDKAYAKVKSKNKTTHFRMIFDCQNFWTFDFQLSTFAKYRQFSANAVPYWKVFRAAFLCLWWIFGKSKLAKKLFVKCLMWLISPSILCNARSHQYRVNGTKMLFCFTINLCLKIYSSFCTEHLILLQFWKCCYHKGPFK